MNERPFAFLYEERGQERSIFGENWCGPPVFRPWEETVVARYHLTGNGQDATVSCMACPARFYTVTGWGSEHQKPVCLATGSGSEMAALAHAIAVALSQGMLVLKELTND